MDRIQVLKNIEQGVYNDCLPPVSPPSIPDYNAVADDPSSVRELLSDYCEAMTRFEQEKSVRDDQVKSGMLRFRADVESLLITPPGRVWYAQRLPRLWDLAIRNAEKNYRVSEGMLRECLSNMETYVAVMFLVDSPVRALDMRSPEYQVVAETPLVVKALDGESVLEFAARIGPLMENIKRGVPEWIPRIRLSHRGNEIPVPEGAIGVSDDFSNYVYGGFRNLTRKGPPPE